MFYLIRSRNAIAKARQATRRFNIVLYLSFQSPFTKPLHCLSSSAQVDSAPLCAAKDAPYQKNVCAIPRSTAMKILNDKAIKKLSNKVDKYHRSNNIPSENTLRKILFIALLEEADLAYFELPPEKYIPIILSCQGVFLKEIRESPHHPGVTAIAKFLASYQPLKLKSDLINNLPLDDEFDDDFEFEVYYSKEKETEDSIRKLFKHLSQTEGDRHDRLVLIGYFVEIFFSRNDILMLKRIYSQYLFSFRNADSKLFFGGIKRLVTASLKLDPAFSIVLVARLLSSGKTSTDRRNLKETFTGMVHYFSSKNHPDRKGVLFQFFEIISLPENIKHVSLVLNECGLASQLMYQTIIKYIAEQERGHLTEDTHPILAAVMSLLDLSNQEAWPPLKFRSYHVAMTTAFSESFKEDALVSADERKASYAAAIEIFALARTNSELDSEMLKSFIFGLVKGGSWGLALKTFFQLPDLRSLEVYRAIFYGCLKQKTSRGDILKILAEFKQDNLVADLPLYTMMLQLLFQAHLLPELFQAYGAIQSQSGTHGSLGPLNEASYASGQLKMDGRLAVVLYKALTRLPWHNLAIDSFSAKMIENITAALETSPDSDSAFVLTARLALYRKLLQNAKALPVILQLMQGFEPIDQGAHSAIVISLSRFNKEEISKLWSILNPPGSEDLLEGVTWFDFDPRLPYPNTTTSSLPLTEAESLHEALDQDERKANVMEILRGIVQNPNQKGNIISKALLTIHA